MDASKFAIAIINDKPIDIYNNEKMTRDFTYIDDIVEGINLILFHPPKENDAILFDNNPSISSVLLKFMDYIHYFEMALNKTAIKNYLPMQQGDVVNTFADISQIKIKFKYSPKVSIEEGIRRYIEWHLYYYNIKMT